MQRALLVCLTIAAGIGLICAAADSPSPVPQYTAKNELLRPDNYREWVFLSSGLGMSYSPAPGNMVMFTNVFVPQWAYHEFLKSGKWPDKLIRWGWPSRSRTITLPTRGSISVSTRTQNPRRRIPSGHAGNVTKTTRPSNTASSSSTQR
jgi:hypothetical protein